MKPFYPARGLHSNYRLGVLAVGSLLRTGWELMDLEFTFIGIQSYSWTLWMSLRVKLRLLSAKNHESTRPVACVRRSRTSTCITSKTTPISNASRPNEHNAPRRQYKRRTALVEARSSQAVTCDAGRPVKAEHCCLFAGTTREVLLCLRPHPTPTTHDPTVPPTKPAHPTMETPTSNSTEPSAAEMAPSNTPSNSARPPQTAHAEMSDRLASIRKQIEGAIQDIAKWQEEQGITAKSEHDGSSEKQQSDP
jgi:hypothetical protein